MPPILRALDLSDAASILLLALYMLIASVLVAIGIYDARHTIIPDAWAYLFGVAALAVALLTHFAPLYITLLSGPAAALPLFLLWFVSGGTWMGLGDAKLALGIGWFMGPLYGVITIFLAFVVGAIVSVCILLPLPHIRRFLHDRGIVRWRGRAAHFTMKSEVAFGPFLVASFFIVWLLLLYDVPLPL